MLEMVMFGGQASHTGSEARVVGAFGVCRGIAEPSIAADGIATTIAVAGAATVDGRFQGGNRGIDCTRITAFDCLNECCDVARDIAGCCR